MLRALALGLLVLMRRPAKRKCGSISKVWLDWTLQLQAVTVVIIVNEVLLSSVHGFFLLFFFSQQQDPMGHAAFLLPFCCLWGMELSFKQAV